MRGLILFVNLSILAFSLSAQNPRMAMYESSPMMVNPAWTGKFKGKIQLGAHGSMMRYDVKDTTPDPRMLHTNFSVEYRSKYDKEDEPNQCDCDFWHSQLPALCGREDCSC